MFKINNDKIVVVPIDKERATIDDGRFILNPNIIPAICPKCGTEGTIGKRQRIKAPYDWKFWSAIGGLIGVPILFGVCAAIISLVWGNEAFQEVLPYGVGIAIFLAAFSGLQMSNTNRENWFLTFYFCKQCEKEYKKLAFVGRLLGWGTIILVLAMLTIAVINPALHLTEQLLQILVWVLLVGAVIVLLGFIINRFQRSIFRGLSAQWMNRKSSLKIKINNPLALENIKSKMPID